MMANDSKTLWMFNRPSLTSCEFNGVCYCALVILQLFDEYLLEIQCFSIRVPEGRCGNRMTDITIYYPFFWNLATWYHISLNASVHNCYHTTILLMIEILPGTVAWIWKGTSLKINGWKLKITHNQNPGNYLNQASIFGLPIIFCGCFWFICHILYDEIIWIPT